MHGYCPCPLEIAEPDVAGLVCSDTTSVIPADPWVPESREVTIHKPVIDLDLPCSLVPSGTPGNFHLYIDEGVSFEDYLGVLKAMAKAGLVQWGFVNTTEERGFGAVRHPDRPKGAGT
jgi:hypothetical protein